MTDTHLADERAPGGAIDLATIASCGDPIHETDPPEGGGGGNETHDPDEDIDHVNIDGSVEITEADDDLEEGRGHVHLVIDVSCVPPGESIPPDEDGNIHYSEGELEGELELEPGEYASVHRLATAHTSPPT